MNAIVDLAAALKDRKGIVAPKARTAPATRTPAPARAPAPAPPTPPAPPPARAPAKDTGAEAGPRRRGKSNRRSRPDPRHWARLKARVQAEESRADRAETALAKLQATMVAMPWKTIKEMDREIKRLTAALERVERPMPQLRLNAAWKRIEELEAENKELWKANREIERLRVAEDVCAAKLRASSRVNYQLNGRVNSAQARIDAIEAEAAALHADAEIEQAALRFQIKDRDHEIRKLRDAAKDRPIPQRRIAELWQRVEALTTENEQLRKKLQGETA